jgi:hypothetical protein
MKMDWHAWHDDYDKPGTPLALSCARTAAR